MTAALDVLRRVGIGVGIATGAAALELLGRAAFDDPTDVSGLDEAHPAGAAGAPERTARSWMGRTLGGLLDWAQVGASQAVRGVEGLFGHHASHADAQRDSGASTPRAQAVASWTALHEAMAERGASGAYNDHASGLPHVASAWSFGQSIAASLDVATLTGDWSATNAQFARLPDYGQRGGIASTAFGYAPGVGPNTREGRYWDDNAWIGLDLMQAYSATKDTSYLDRALALVPLLKAGQTDGGGLLWTDEPGAGATINTCTNGPALELLLRLYGATGRPELLAMATQVDHALETQLRQPDGTYADLVTSSGELGPAKYSYNQGTPIGADVLWYGIDHDPARLAHAKQTADAALRWLGTGDTLWKQAPAFNAIFFRNLMALDAVAPDPRYRAALQAYVDRGWREARDPATGLFTKGDVGAYDGGNPGGLLDQSGWVQMQALLAMPTGATRPDVA